MRRKETMGKTAKTWLGMALACGLALAAAAGTCGRANEKGEACAGKKWRCNQCMAVGCDNAECGDTLQSAGSKSRECRVCGSADWVEID